ncbi:MAG: hypothetical protein A3I88_03215 [Candidatus Portnoybacteria bacterium RIFCSPLOWO2_12_FULL_39_9]|uniref:Type 4 fimbrial biogenesis protein PilX N-terminal domain-containing protein n=1 Tax=Candidatus Portnoybacteria bacterium RIFCSPHIGHO2_12_FULL_38_9 TaxID=1801997 RepID=A0A1G2FFB6_9BACT|nr:MAG: hypothetical protein A3H00_00765 [Candidatus Portnoybacteria bacterium RBG_13_40_8]OGZ36044.1 MAG: hypothetical protein A2646_00820 [Candidatus Portnoybacteria bacterium RIFCSPHIGHO2_02_FULL_39_12]OGZ36733.1 MAG: hypothetical protein A3J64_03320 [Candidatus Portnoybacteria bacterium RIFCSPHIGHO2_12_FULL_38_9]OGZ38092.1 MAG: hypothetical protein A3F21_00920 [Candidatus Portnoybacteria bacterium RIFCSPLOWO2_01_FULL_38_39]OGZ40099.1 MAG: hypothetical protein A3I88_03215 [Candidatus Portnoy
MNKQNGAVSLLLTILVLAGILVIALGISKIILQEIRMTGQVGESTKAYQAADTGIEWALYQVIKVKQPIPDSKLCANNGWTNLDSQTAYCLEITQGTPQTPEKIKAIGRVNRVRRAVEIKAVEI